MVERAEGGISHEELEQLKQKFSFLEELMKKACYVPLFSIKVKQVDNRLFDCRNSGFSSDSGYEYTWNYYAIKGSDIHILGRPGMMYKSVGESLEHLGVVPDFIISADYTTKKHNGDSWNDVELTIYEP